MTFSSPVELDAQALMTWALAFSPMRMDTDPRRLTNDNPIKMTRINPSVDVVRAGPHPSASVAELAECTSRAPHLAFRPIVWHVITRRRIALQLTGVSKANRSTCFGSLTPSRRSWPGVHGHRCEEGWPEGRPGRVRGVGGRPGRRTPLGGVHTLVVRSGQAVQALSTAEAAKPLGDLGLQGGLAARNASLGETLPQVKALVAEWFGASQQN
jgi:hypothetical protein